MGPKRDGVMNDKQRTSQIYNVDTPFFYDLLWFRFRFGVRGDGVTGVCLFALEGIQRLSQGHSERDIEQAMGLHHTQHVALLVHLACQVWFCCIHLRFFAYLIFVSRSRFSPCRSSCMAHVSLTQFLSYFWRIPQRKRAIYHLEPARHVYPRRIKSRHTRWARFDDTILHGPSG